MHWSQNFIGISYERMDCSRLVAHVLDREFKLIKTASYMMSKSPLAYRKDSKEIEINQSPIAERVDDGEEMDGDGVLMGTGGQLHHVGILCLINDRKFVLHTTKGTGSILQPIQSIRTNYTIEGYYSWKE
jgi:hypothetical protein